MRVLPFRAAPAAVTTPAVSDTPCTCRGAALQVRRPRSRCSTATACGETATGAEHSSGLCVASARSAGAPLPDLLEALLQRILARLCVVHGRKCGSSGRAAARQSRLHPAQHAAAHARSIFFGTLCLPHSFQSGVSSLSTTSSRSLPMRTRGLAAAPAAQSSRASASRHGVRARGCRLLQVMQGGRRVGGARVPVISRRGEDSALTINLPSKQGEWRAVLVHGGVLRQCRQSARCPAPQQCYNGSRKRI